VRRIRHHALLFAVPYAYDALRLAGAAYLLWLSVAGREAERTLAVSGEQACPRRTAQIVRDGFVTNLLKPKDRDAAIWRCCRSSSIRFRAAC